MGDPADDLGAGGIYETLQLVQMLLNSPNAGRAPTVADWGSDEDCALSGSGRFVQSWNIPAFAQAGGKCSEDTTLLPLNCRHTHVVVRLIGPFP
ncbi:MAG TPA: hypothetical protein VNO52_15245 [Methylomirabilota bacterium]|nr:hypothetical protein [Methylomirabilota bacterium]